MCCGRTLADLNPAGTAASIDGRVLVFGAHTVAEDGGESSVARVQRLRAASGHYADLAPIPMPVDDMVALVYRDRYVYPVSVRHKTQRISAGFSRPVPFLSPGAT
jgi:hypothetical protein